MAILFCCEKVYIYSNTTLNELLHAIGFETYH